MFYLSRIKVVASIFLEVIFAHFLRLRRKKPGYPGLRYRSGPAYGGSASHPSYPLRPRGFPPFGKLKFAQRK
jgi:hypothetical protein